MDAINLDKHTRNLPVVIAVLLIVVSVTGTIVAFSFAQDPCNDLWCHALHGRILLEQGRFPKFSDYSFIAGENVSMRKINWLPGLLFHCLLKRFGYYGLIAFKLWGLSIIGICIMLWLREEGLPWSLATLAVPGTMLVSWWRIMPRGDFVNMVLLAVYLYILSRYRRRRDRSIWLLPLLQVFWIQFHYLACLGIFVIGVYATEGIFGVWYRKWRYREPSPLLPLYNRKLLGVALLCFITSFANIATYYKVFYPFRALWEMDSSRKELYDFVVEYKPLVGIVIHNIFLFAVLIAVFFLAVLLLYLGKKKLAWCSLLFLTVLVWPTLDLHVHMPALFLPAVLATFLATLCLLGNIPRVSIAHFILVVVFSVVAIRFRRFGGILGVVIVPIICIYAWQLYQNNLANCHMIKKWRHCLGNAFFITAVAANVLLTTLVVSNLFFQWIGLLDRCRPYVSPVLKPVHAVEFINKHRIYGNIYTNYDSGGFVGYHVYPHGKIFIHSLSFWYSKSHFQIFKKMANTQVDPELLASAYSIDVMLLSIQYKKIRRIWQQLHVSKRWLLIYLDQMAAIYIRRGTPLARRLEPLVVDLHNFSIDERQIFPPYGFHWLGNFFFSLHYYEQAKHFYQRALDSSTLYRWPTYNNLAVIAMREKNFSKALDYLHAALQTDNDKDKLMQNLEPVLEKLPFDKRKSPKYRQVMDMYLRWKARQVFSDHH